MYVHKLKYLHACLLNIPGHIALRLLKYLNILKLRSSYACMDDRKISTHLFNLLNLMLVYLVLGFCYDRISHFLETHLNVGFHVC